MLDVLHSRPTLSHDASDHADEVNRHVDRKLFKWLLDAVLRSMDKHLRPRDLELEAFATHLLHKDCELKLAAAAHLEGFA